MSSTPRSSAAPAHPTCAREGCDQPAIKRGAKGPPRRYCSNACRQAAYYLRRDRRQPDQQRDVLGEAVALLDQTFADLPGPQKVSPDGVRLMRLAVALRGYHERTR